PCHPHPAHCRRSRRLADSGRRESRRTRRHAGRGSTPCAARRGTRATTAKPCVCQRHDPRRVAGLPGATLSCRQPIRLPARRKQDVPAGGPILCHRFVSASLPAMIAFQDPALDWSPVPASQNQTLERLLRLSTDPALGKAKVRSGRGTSLPFYQDHALLEYIVAPVIGESALVYLLAGHERGGLQWLDGTSAPIHRANDLEKVSITAAAAISYLRFFM